MMHKEDLRRTLISIKNKNFSSTMEYDPYTLTTEAIKYIGDPDPSLRDDLVLSFIEAMILKQFLTNSEVKSLLNICINNLNFGLGKTDDSVFTRTFSMLIIAIILYRHRMMGFLNDGDLRNIFEKVLYSYKNDVDVRGYIDSKGWAHGTAYGADVFLEFTYLSEINQEMMQRILEVIFHKAKVNNYGYIHEEDERMARVVAQIINKKKLSSQFIIDWIKTFELAPASGVKFIVRRNNVRNFLRSLYFLLVKDHRSYLYCDTILQVIEKNYE